ncbi:MAG: hydrolase [Ignavibacteriaceae bacterium]|nr:MAG: hydrolase [Ignavibacteriaceae bacterium]
MERKIFFTADTHFNHAGIIKSCNRPFANVDEMNEALIQNWNNKVDVLDEVYHLGDFIWKGNSQRVQEIIYRLNGKIYIIKGNHDHSQQVKYYENCSNVGWVKDYFELKIDNTFDEIDELMKANNTTFLQNITKMQFVLFHYGMRVWNKSHYGSFHLYGHSHGNLPPIRNSWDVGVDANNYEPIELNEVIKKIQVNNGNL